jgi:hypothetical protein
MNATQKLLSRRPKSLRVLAASGQLGYGIPEDSLKAGLDRCPDFIGCDMGSIDPGPAYLGSGRMATSPDMTRRDLRLVINAARKLDVPLIIGTAGTSGAAPHLQATLEMVQSIAKMDGLNFKLAVIEADVSAERVIKALDANELLALGGTLEVTADEIKRCTHIVGQMGCEPFIRALEQDPDIIIAGRACDTAIFAAIPKLLGFDMAAVMHMAKIIECTSICCEPGGRDAMLATLDADGFELESMNPQRRATPLSVAAHSLYEQSDPLTFTEPDGTLNVSQATYTALDERRTRVTGATWTEAARPTIKVEASAPIGFRSVLLSATVDPRVIAKLPDLLTVVESTTRGLVPGSYQIYPRLYGLNGVSSPSALEPVPSPREVFILIEVIASAEDLAMAVTKTFKQFLLHQGFPGRLSTGGNIAFPFTPPELSAGQAFRYVLYHTLPAPDSELLFPVSIHTY